MGKTIFAAVIASILASIATVLVMGSFQSERRADEAKAREAAEAIAKVEYDRIVRRVTELEKRPAAPRVERRPAAEEAATQPDAPVTAPAPAALAPDGTPYVSRAELEEFAKSHGGAVTNGVVTEVKAAEAKSLEDIAREQNLSAAEEANIRNILRESEEEMVRCLFGDKPIAEVTREVMAAKDDPDKKEALLQGVMQNAIGNLAKLATAESRTKKKVEGVLGKERAATFLAAPRKPVIAAEFEEFFDDF